jgi:hypothetical protein
MARRELASISPTHARLDYVLDNLVEMVPPEAIENPMVKIFLTFIRESKKDLRRLPEEFILGLSQPIGRAFMWVAEGDNEIMAGNPMFELPSEFTDYPPSPDDDDSSSSDDSSSDDDDDFDDSED